MKSTSRQMERNWLTILLNSLHLNFGLCTNSNLHKRCSHHQSEALVKELKNLRINIINSISSPVVSGFFSSFAKTQLVLWMNWTSPAICLISIIWFPIKQDPRWFWCSLLQTVITFILLWKRFDFYQNYLDCGDYPTLSYRWRSY